MKTIVLKSSAVLVFLLMFSVQTWASHFRFGHLTWQPKPSVSSTTAEFTLVCAFRWDGYGSPAVGAIITENIGGTQLNFGDVSFTGTLKFLVISIDPAKNWLLGKALEPGSTTKTTIDHTYATADNGGAPWLAEINSGDRTGVEINNPNGRYRVSTLVELGSGNRSPVSSLPAIVNLTQSATASFFVPAADPDPNTSLSYRLASASEAGSGFSQPTAGGFPLSINSTTGLVSWNTTGTVLSGLYSCQVIIEDRNATTGALKTQVAIDFLIEIVSCPAGNVAPIFASTSPNCGITFSLKAGDNISFTMAASDPDAGDVVTLNTAGVPTGASITPGLPTSGNPVSSVFSWTPTIADAAGSPYVVTFSATDNCGAQVLCYYTIKVSACPTISVNAGADQTVYFGYPPAECATLSASVSGGTTPYTYLWNTGATTPSITKCPSATTTFSVVVTDKNGCQGSDVVIVNVVDVRCGNKLDKVLVCHIPLGNPDNKHNICISPNAVPAHLAEHHDYLGSCLQISPLISNSSNSKKWNAQEINFLVSPNPISDQTIIEFSIPSSENVSVILYDLRGIAVATLYLGYVEGGDVYNVNFDGSKLANGIYIAMLKSESYNESFKLNVIK